MKVKRKTIATCLMLVFGALFTYYLYRTGHDSFFADGIVLIFLAVCFLVCFVPLVRQNNKDFQLSKRVVDYFPTSIGVLFILLNVGLIGYQGYRANKESLVTGFYDGGFNGVSIDFKTDGTYVMANGSGLGESYFYGTYSIKDSIITLDKSNIDNCITTNELVIRTENDGHSGSISTKGPAKYIIQIDGSGAEIDRDFRFRVTKDNM